MRAENVKCTKDEMTKPIWDLEAAEGKDYNPVLSNHVGLGDYADFKASMYVGASGDCVAATIGLMLKTPYIFPTLGALVKSYEVTSKKTSAAILKDYKKT